MNKDELRPAVKVANEVCDEMEEYGPSFATRIIEADRAEIARLTEQRVVKEIVAWLMDPGYTGINQRDMTIALRIQNREWKP